MVSSVSVLAYIVCSVSVCVSDISVCNCVSVSGISVCVTV